MTSTVAPQADKPRARNMFNTWKWTSENDLETTLDTNSKRSKFDVAPAFDEEFKDPQRLAEMRISGFVIDPRKSKWSGKWDLLMIACLFFTAVVTPVEIVFLDEGAQVTALWIVNRVIDFCFCLDMIICFFLAFQRPASWGGYFVVNQRVIVCHYLSGWFIIDFVSVLPIWLVTLDYNNPWAYSAASAVVAMNTSSSSSSPGEDVSIATLPRIIRLMRLVKLARVLKASRVLQRNILDILMHEFGTVRDSFVLFLCPPQPPHPLQPPRPPPAPPHPILITPSNPLDPLTPLPLSPPPVSGPCRRTPSSRSPS
jgi:hypothetical protein